MGVFLRVGGMGLGILLSSNAGMCIASGGIRDGTVLRAKAGCGLVSAGELVSLGNSS